MNYQTQTILTGATKTVSTMTISSTAAFSLFEVGIMKEQCFETIIADLGSVKSVGWVSHRHYTSSDSSSNFTVLLSEDGVNVSFFLIMG